MNDPTNVSWPAWSLVSQVLGLSIVSSSLTVAAAWVWKRWRRGDEGMISAQHDQVELQRALAGVTNDQILRVFEVQNRIIADSVQHHQECEKRVQALEDRSASRQARIDVLEIKLDAAEERIDKLEGMLRTAGIPVP